MSPISRLSQLGLTLLVLGLAPLPLRSAEPQVGAVLQPFVDSGTLAGAVVLVASPEKVLALDAVGFADVAAKTPLRTDALFWIASMSKPMTAAAVMMLVDEGKVKLDDPVEKYLPIFQGQMLTAESSPERVVLTKPAHPITVREVLSHTSGLPFMSIVEQQAHHIDTLPLREAVLSYALAPLKSEPGSKYDYSNAGINTAGRIVEVVSGMPYEVFMQQRLFDPLGMKDTTFRPNSEQAQRLAKSYRPDANKTALEETKIEQLTYPLTSQDRYPCPGGGLFATAADVAVFCQMVLSGGAIAGKRYLSEAAVREMTTTQTGKLLDQSNGEGGYGLGWSTSRKSTDPPGGPISGQAILGNCGHGGAYATNMSLDPQRRLITVFMVQHAGYPGPDGGKIHGTFVNAANEAFGK